MCREVRRNLVAPSRPASWAQLQQTAVTLDRGIEVQRSPTAPTVRAVAETAPHSIILSSVLTCAKKLDAMQLARRSSRKAWQYRNISAIPLHTPCCTDARIHVKSRYQEHADISAEQIGYISR